MKTKIILVVLIVSTGLCQTSFAQDADVQSVLRKTSTAGLRLNLYTGFGNRDPIIAGATLNIPVLSLSEQASIRLMPGIGLGRLSGLDLSLGVVVEWAHGFGAWYVGVVAAGHALGALDSGVEAGLVAGIRFLPEAAIRPYLQLRTLVDLFDRKADTQVTVGVNIPLQ